MHGSFFTLQCAAFEDGRAIDKQAGELAAQLALIDEI